MKPGVPESWEPYVHFSGARQPSTLHHYLTAALKALYQHSVYG
jgi:hypothetical protein